MGGEKKYDWKYYTCGYRLDVIYLLIYFLFTAFITSLKKNDPLF